MRCVRTAACLLLGLPAFSCDASSDATGVVVVISAGPETTANVEGLSFWVYAGAAGDPTGGHLVVSGGGVATGGHVTFPYTIRFGPRGNDASRVFRVVVEAHSRDFRTKAASSVISGYRLGHRLRVDMKLWDECNGITCGSESVTCAVPVLEADCVDAYVDPESLPDYVSIEDAGVRD